MKSAQAAVSVCSLPLKGRGIAYGFEAGIARSSKMDSVDDSRITGGVECRNSRRLFGGCRTQERTTRGTICWKFWSLPLRLLWLAPKAPRTWPRLAAARNGCFDCSFGWSTAFPATTRSVGCSVCWTHEPSRPHSGGSCRHSPSATGWTSVVWWRSTEKPCAGPSSGAGKVRRCTWSTSGLWRRGCAWLSARPPVATRLQAPWRCWICWTSKAALLRPMRCIAIAALPQRCSSAAATTCWRSRKIRASCLLPPAGTLVAAEPAALPNSATPPLTIGANGGAPPLCAIPASLPHTTFPGSLRWAASPLADAPKAAAPSRRSCATSFFPNTFPPSGCCASCALIGASRIGCIGSSMSSSTRIAIEVERTTLPRTSRYSEGSLSMSYDPILPRRLCVRKSSALDGTMPSFWVCSAICDSPAGHRGMGAQHGPGQRLLELLQRPICPWSGRFRRSGLRSHDMRNVLWRRFFGLLHKKTRQIPDVNDLLGGLPKLVVLENLFQTFYQLAFFRSNLLMRLHQFIEIGDLLVGKGQNV